MISNFKDINNLLLEIDKKLKPKISIYIIGGTVLLYRGLKPATKDIDLVVKDASTFQLLSQILINMGFGKQPVKYKNMNVSEQFVRDDIIIDLFNSSVCSKFSLSDKMAARAELLGDFKRIKPYLCSNEDIFAFKTMTDRDGDIDDCIEIIKTNPDWEVILGELKHQIKLSGENIWITWIGERLEILEDKGLIIPIIKDVHKMVENYYNTLDL
ncbi:hypothetical protein K9M79_01850 [Candidatus Woesearchaeota archaeon]|nr:hypothetical protein [Candidatus Woesearchaeota archaeon]